MPMLMSERRPAAFRRGTRDEAQVVARRPPRIATGDGEERVDAGLRAAGADARQAVRDERPIDPVEAYDVGDGAERDEIEQRPEIGLRAVRELTPVPQHGAGREQHVEHDTDPGKMLSRKRAPALIGIDDQRGRGKRRRREVVVGDQHFETERRGRRDAVMARDAVVDGHDEDRRERRRLSDDLRREPVAVLEAIRHEELDDGAHRREPAHPDGAGGGAVRVVVGDDHDLLAVADRIGEARRGEVDSLHCRERRQRREIDVELLSRRDAARREHARQHGMDTRSGECCGGRWNRTTHDVHQPALIAVSSSAPRSRVL
jgi:hypothetical protein